MRSMTVVVVLEIEELHLQIRGRPAQRAIQAFAPNRAGEPFNEGMRQQHVRDRLDVLHVEDPKIPLPLMEPIECSWSELTYVGGIWPRVARLNIRHSAMPSTLPR
jgi:hypothetical protein